MEPKQLCPICKAMVKSSERYPDYICNKCVVDITDINGVAVTFSNADIFGGCKGWYHKNGEREVYSSNICYINNIECFAEEARFGGIVIRPKRQ